MALSCGMIFLHPTHFFVRWVPWVRWLFDSSLLPREYAAMIVEELETPALDLPKRFWRRRVLLTEQNRPWTYSAWTARFRTGDRTASTSKNACKHSLRTGSRVQRGERVPYSAAA